jgi:hypothetical protein
MITDPDDDGPVVLIGEFDEVFRALTRDLAEGERAEIHDADCEVDRRGEGCTCKPLVLVGPLEKA